MKPSDEKGRASFGVKASPSVGHELASRWHAALSLSFGTLCSLVFFFLRLKRRSRHETGAHNLRTCRRRARWPLKLRVVKKSPQTQPQRAPSLRLQRQRQPERRRQRCLAPQSALLWVMWGGRPLGTVSALWLRRHRKGLTILCSVCRGCDYCWQDERTSDGVSHCKARHCRWLLYPCHQKGL